MPMAPWPTTQLEPGTQAIITFWRHTTRRRGNNNHYDAKNSAHDGTSTRNVVGMTDLQPCMHPDWPDGLPRRVMGLILMLLREAMNGSMTEPLIWPAAIPGRLAVIIRLSFLRWRRWAGGAWCVSIPRLVDGSRRSKHWQHFVAVLLRQLGASASESHGHLHHSAESGVRQDLNGRCGPFGRWPAKWVCACEIS